MQFFYERYYLECLIMALFILLITVYFIIHVGYWGIKSLKGKYLSRKDIFKCISLIVLFMFFLCVVCGHLAHGGIQLLNEKEKDSMIMQGDITEIKKLGIFSLPRIECDYYEDLKFGDPQGYEFTINGIQCTAPAKGTLKVGDYVEVEYLPKSGYILYINEIGEE